MEQIIALIIAMAIQHGVDPHLAVAIAKTESRMNPAAVGTIGEIGLFQLRPEYFAETCEDVAKEDVVSTIENQVVVKGQLKIFKKKKFACGHELFDVMVNIETGIKNLADLQKRCAGLGPAYFICHNLGVRGGHRIQFPREFAYYKAVMKNLTISEEQYVQNSQSSRSIASAY